MLNKVKARWPDVERLEDAPNDTSKANITAVCISFMHLIVVLL